VPYKPRRDIIRFQIGESVQIGAGIMTKSIGATGVITEIIESPHARTLDKYMVQIDGDDQPTAFWDFQLNATGPLR
jgi:hypothetical protein